jgi:O-antigen ligase
MHMLRIGGALLCLAGLTFYGFNMNNPNPVRWACLSAVVCLALFVWTFRGELRVSRASVIALLFVAYAAMSLLWTPDWREGLLSLYNLVVLTGLFLTVQNMDREWLAKAVPVVASVAVMLSIAGTVMWPESIGLSGNENFQAEFLCLLIPSCLIGMTSWSEKTIGALCLMSAVLGSVVLFGLNASDAKWAGLGGLAGLLILALGTSRPRGALIMLVSGSLALWILLSQRVLTSIGQRLELGYNTILMWLEHPIFGTGIGGFGYYYPDFQEAHTGLINSRSMWGMWLFAGAAHNEYIQALAVFGVAGIVILGAFVWVAFKDRAADPLANWSLVVLSILAGLSAVNFPLQNPATAAIGVIALAMMLKPGEAFDVHSTVIGSRDHHRVRGDGIPVDTG